MASDIFLNVKLVTCGYDKYFVIPFQICHAVRPKHEITKAYSTIFPILETTTKTTTRIEIIRRKKIKVFDIKFVCNQQDQQLKIVRGKKKERCHIQNQHSKKKEEQSQIKLTAWVKRKKSITCRINIIRRKKKKCQIRKSKKNKRSVKLNDNIRVTRKKKEREINETSKSASLKERR